MYSSKGVTLIELMVTIAVLAVLLTLAAPSFGDFFQRYRLRGAADDVVSLIAISRAEAITRNRDVAIRFAGSGAAWCVGGVATAEPSTPGTAVDTTPGCTCNSDCKIGDKVMEVAGSDHQGVTLAALPTGFVFDRLNGTVSPLSAATATFNSPNGKYALSVDVSPLGRGRLCVPAGKPAMTGFETC